MDEFETTDLDLDGSPHFRATIAGRRPTMIFWHPGLISRFGSGRQHFESRDRAGVCIALVTILRHEDSPELVVKVLSRGRLDALDVLLGWAATIGYRRVWLPDRVVELNGAGSAVGTRVGTRCPSCRSRWRTRSPSSGWPCVSGATSPPPARCAAEAFRGGRPASAGLGPPRANWGCRAQDALARAELRLAGGLRHGHAGGLARSDVDPRGARPRERSSGAVTTYAK